MSSYIKKEQILIYKMLTLLCVQTSVSFFTQLNFSQCAIIHRRWRFSVTAMTLPALHSTSCQLRSRETCAGHIPYTRQMSSVINQSNFEMKKVFSIVTGNLKNRWHRRRLPPPPVPKDSYRTSSSSVYFSPSSF